MVIANIYCVLVMCQGSELCVLYGLAYEFIFPYYFTNNKLQIRIL